MCPHVAPHHLPGEETAEPRERQVVQQQQPFDPLVGGLQDVQEREHAGIVDQHVDVDTRVADPGEQLAGRLDTGQVDALDAHLGAWAGADLRSRRLQRRTVVADQHQPVARRRQAQRITAADAAPGARDERPFGPFRDQTPSHRHLILRSSRHSFSGISSLQLWQHCMSTEYMRAMQ